MRRLFPQSHKTTCTCQCYVFKQKQNKQFVDSFYPHPHALTGQTIKKANSNRSTFLFCEQIRKLHALPKTNVCILSLHTSTSTTHPVPIKTRYEHFRGFIKGQAPDKLTGSEVNFACLV